MGQSSTAQTNSGSTFPPSSAVHAGGVHGEATTCRPATAPAKTPNASSRAGPQTKQRPNGRVPRSAVGGRRDARLVEAHRLRDLDVEPGDRARLGDRASPSSTRTEPSGSRATLEHPVQRNRSAQADLGEAVDKPATTPEE